MPDAAPLRVLVQNTSRPADRPPITAEQLASALTAVPDLARPLDIKVALEAETDPAVFVFLPLAACSHRSCWAG
jgi:hypothetical protein